MQISPLWDKYRQSYCYFYDLLFKPSGDKFANSHTTLRTVSSHCGSLPAVGAVALQPTPFFSTWKEPKVEKKQQGMVGYWFQVSKVTLGSHGLLKRLRVLG